MKKVIAVLLSAFMLLTFMPTMAFANTDSNIEHYSFSVPNSTITFNPTWEKNSSNVNVYELEYDFEKAPKSFSVKKNCKLSLSSINVGNSELTIVGKNGYDGKIILPVTIAPLYAKDFEFSLKKYTMTYNGKEQLPKLRYCSIRGEYEYMDEGEPCSYEDLFDVDVYNRGDCSISFDQNADYVSIGNKQVKCKISFKGNIIGNFEETVKFSIAPKNTKFTSVKGGHKKLTLKWKKQTSNTDGYIVSIIDFYRGGWKHYNIKSNKTTKKVITGLKANRKYQVNISTYKIVDGKRIEADGYSINAKTK